MDDPSEEEVAALATWAGSGAMALTGDRDGPPRPEPALLASVMGDLAVELATWTGRWGSRVSLDGPALLGERAAFTGMARNGSVSVGGAAHFARSSDGWVVVNLPRPEDVAALPALVGAAVEPDDWTAIQAGLAAMGSAEIEAQAAVLGMAVAVAGRPEAPGEPVRLLAEGAARTVSTRPLVVDLTSLWAGPLAASLLGEAGARVVKVESATRPDGARRGPEGFFDLLNGGKECLALDFDASGDIGVLRDLLGRADLVIEGSRPRVMDRLGIEPAALAARGVNWVSITGHGRTGAAADRIGFGDDAAVAGGLWLERCPPAGAGPPMFVADAVADPVAGLVAAAAGAAALAGPRALVAEVPLARVAAWARGPMVTAPVAVDGAGWAVGVGDRRVAVRAPVHRRPRRRARPLGADSDPLRAELAVPAG